MSDASQVASAVRRQRDRAVELLVEAVRAPSVTGREAEVAPVFEAALRDVGLDVHLQYVDPAKVGDAFPFWDREADLHSRPNVIARWPSGSGAPALVLNGHMDVVPAGEESGWLDSPFAGSVRGGRVFGRGTADMKGGLVAAVVAISALQDLGVEPATDVEVQCVIGEETGGLGSISAIIQGGPVASVIVLEPTDLAIARAQAGVFKFSVEVGGVPAHTSVPWVGKSAFDHLCAVHEAMQRFAAKQVGSAGHPLFTSWPAATPIVLGMVRAGHHGWTLPDRATATGRYGVLPGGSGEEVRDELQAYLTATFADHPWLSQQPARLIWDHGVFPAWETPEDDPLVRSLVDGARQVLGSPVLRGMPYGSDASHFASLCDASLAIFGPGSITDAHVPNESVAVDDVLAAATVLAITLQRWERHDP